MNHLAQAAAVILLIELIVVLLVFLAISGGLAFGLWWARRKIGWAFEKGNTYVRLGTRYVHRGIDVAAKPFIAVSAVASKIKGTTEAIREDVRRNWRRPTIQEMAPTEAIPAEPQAAAEPEAPVPLV